jgi:hypothetical protein
VRGLDAGADHVRQWARVDVRRGQLQRSRVRARRRLRLDGRDLHGPRGGVPMKRLWRLLHAMWRAVTGRGFLPAPKPVRFWRLLPAGRQAVHLYVGRLEDLENYKPPRAHLGMRIYVRALDRVYQWSQGRREEVDGAACIYPVDE